MVLVLSVFFLFFAACSHRPIEELSFADIAVKSAQKAKADALAPDLYRKAENLYLRAKRDFNEGYFDSSRTYSNEARIAAEQAEFQALWKQTKVHSATTGDSGAPLPASSALPDGKYEEDYMPAPRLAPPKNGP